MSWIDASNVDTLSDCAGTLDGDGCIGMDLNDTVRALLGWCKFALDIADKDINIITMFIVVFNARTILTSIVVENILLTTGVDLSLIHI